jgi:hypothetical protein
MRAAVSTYLFSCNSQDLTLHTGLTALVVAVRCPPSTLNFQSPRYREGMAATANLIIGDYAAMWTGESERRMNIFPLRGSGLRSCGPTGLRSKRMRRGSGLQPPPNRTSPAALDPPAMGIIDSPSGNIGQ